MRWTNWRTIVGVVLLVLGGLALAQSLGYLPSGGFLLAVIFAVLFGGAGVAFLSVAFRDQQNWWAIIPGLVLLSLGVLIAGGELVPGFTEKYGGTLFLGGISLAFWVVYFLQRKFWWAIIPGGTLLTLAVVAGLDNVSGFDTGSVFFLGLAITFGLLAIVPVEGQRMNWPWIPAVVLLVLAAAISLGSTSAFNLIWPAALILAGIFLVYRAVAVR